MIKARGEINGTEFVMVGLSRKNCERLLDGKPIHFKFADIGITEIKGDFIFVGGETEQDILEELGKNGFDMQGAKVNPVPNPESEGDV